MKKIVHTRAQKIVYAGSVIAAAASVIAAAMYHQVDGTSEAAKWEGVGATIVAIWTLYPPLWMTWEWWEHAHTYTNEQREIFKQAQKLTGSLWLALVAFLGAVFRVGIFK